VKPVVTQFIVYPHADKGCTTDAQGKTKNIDE